MNPAPIQLAPILHKSSIDYKLLLYIPLKGHYLRRIHSFCCTPPSLLTLLANHIAKTRVFFPSPPSNNPLYHILLDNIIFQKKLSFTLESLECIHDTIMSIIFQTMRETMRQEVVPHQTH